MTVTTNPRKPALRREWRGAERMPLREGGHTRERNGDLSRVPFS